MKKGIIFFAFCLACLMGNLYNTTFANNSEEIKINWNDLETSSIKDKKNLQSVLSLDLNKTYDLDEDFNLTNIKIERTSEEKIINYQNILYVYQNTQGQINKIIIKNFGGVSLFSMSLGYAFADKPITYNQYFINEYINTNGDVCKRYKSANENITYIAVFHRPHPQMKPLLLEIQVLPNN